MVAHRNYKSDPFAPLASNFSHQPLDLFMAEMPTSKWLFLNNLRSKTLGQIQNLVPHRLMSRLKSKTTPGDTLRTRLYSSPIDVWIQQIDIDGDGGRPEFGLRGHTSGPYSPAAIRRNWLWTRCRPSMATDRSSPSCSS